MRMASNRKSNQLLRTILFCYVLITINYLFQICSSGGQPSYHPTAKENAKARSDGEANSGADSEQEF